MMMWNRNSWGEWNTQTAFHLSYLSSIEMLFFYTRPVSLDKKWSTQWCKQQHVFNKNLIFHILCQQWTLLFIYASAGSGMCLPKAVVTHFSLVFPHRLNWKTSIAGGYGKFGCTGITHSTVSLFNRRELVLLQLLSTHVYSNTQCGLCVVSGFICFIQHIFVF